MIRAALSPASPSRWFTPAGDDKHLDTWLQGELRREHDGALSEKLPQEWLDLLDEAEPTRH